MFKKAIKREAKGRVALIGPAGAGKSWTMLTLARAMAGPAGKIAAVDTEHGSLAKYADIFDFDVLELDSFSPDNFMKALKAAEQGGYSVFCCDSLSHFWVGKDGALEFVDMAAKRHKDGMGGWKDFRPHERAMVDEMISSPCHIICTMRTKTDYQEQTDPQTNRKKRVKIGLAPVQRDGLEYEFDLVGYMDEENTLVVDKTRCSFYSQKALTKPGAKDFAPFIEWLKGAPTEVKALVPATATPAAVPASAKAATPAPAAEIKDKENPPMKSGVFKVSNVAEYKKDDNTTMFQVVLSDKGGALVMKTPNAEFAKIAREAGTAEVQVTYQAYKSGVALRSILILDSVAH